MANKEVECFQCGNFFSKRIGEINRTIKRRGHHFCSLTCTAIWRNIHYPGKGNMDNLKPGSDCDKFSPFRWHLRNMKRRSHKCTVTLQDLKNQWDKQKGICPYTGQLMENPPRVCNHRNNHPYMASVDRIDSFKGYEPDNIEFVSMIANFAKQRWIPQDVIDFCKKVAEYHD